MLNSTPNPAPTPYPPKQKIAALYRDEWGEWSGHMRATMLGDKIPLLLREAGALLPIVRDGQTIGEAPHMLEVWSGNRQIGLLTLTRPGKNYAGVVNVTDTEAMRVVTYGGLPGGSVSADVLILKRVIGVAAHLFRRR